MGDTRIAYGIMMQKRFEKLQLGSARRRWEINTGVDFRLMIRDCGKRTKWTKNDVHWRDFVGLFA
jgi:hypothetical protein